MSVDEFRDRNDVDYLRWLADHSRGYVINIERTYNPRDVRIHAAYCDHHGDSRSRGHFHRRLDQGLFEVTDGTRQLDDQFQGVSGRRRSGNA